MDSYWLTLHGDPSEYQPLLTEAGGVQATRAAVSAAWSRGFEVRAVWPLQGRLNVMVEGNEHPGDLAELIGDWLGRPEWSPSIQDPTGAVDPELRRCELCQMVVPPHGEHCAYQQTDEGDAEFRRHKVVDLGPTAEPEKVESEHLTTA